MDLALHTKINVFLGVQFSSDTTYNGLTIFIRHASRTRNCVANCIGTLIKKGGKIFSLCFGVLDTCVDHCL